MSDAPEAREEPTSSQREVARKRIQKRRNLQGGLVAYVVVNAFLIGVWAASGAGYFWPGWVLAGWGVGMLLGLWDYVQGLPKPTSTTSSAGCVTRTRDADEADIRPWRRPRGGRMFFRQYQLPCLRSSAT